MGSPKAGCCLIRWELLIATDWRCYPSDFMAKWHEDNTRLDYPREPKPRSSFLFRYQIVSTAAAAHGFVSQPLVVNYLRERPAVVQVTERNSALLAPWQSGQGYVHFQLEYYCFSDLSCDQWQLLSLQAGTWHFGKQSLLYLSKYFPDWHVSVCFCCKKQ